MPLLRYSRWAASRSGPTPESRQRREVVDVQHAPVGEHLHDAKAGDGADVALVLDDGDEPVALRALQLVDAPRELRGVVEVRRQRLHRVERRPGLAGVQLADRHRRRTARSERLATRASGSAPLRQPRSRSASRAERSRASARQAATSESS